MFLNQAFFSLILGFWRAETRILLGAGVCVRAGSCVSTLGFWGAETGILLGSCVSGRDGTCVSTLGSCAINFEWVGFADGDTLGGDV